MFCDNVVAQKIMIRKKKMYIYGTHACYAALKNTKRKINRIYVIENVKDDLVKQFKIPFKIEIKDKNFLNSLLPQDAVHQGIVIDTEPLHVPTIDDIIKNGKSNSTVLILDQIQDPHNIGAIIRTAAAFDVDAIIVQDKYGPSISGLIAKIACGGLEEVPVIKQINLAQSIKKLKQNEYWTICLDERGKINVNNTNMQDNKKAIIMGAEGDGVRKLILESADILVKIPMKENSNVTSLNVSNAAAIALFGICTK